MDAMSLLSTVLNNDVDNQVWPTDVPLTTETITAALQTHSIYVNESYSTPIEEDPDIRDWLPHDKLYGRSERPQVRQCVRELTTLQPNCRRALDLYRYYVFGNGFNIKIEPRFNDDDESITKRTAETIRTANNAWDETLDYNSPWWSFSEAGARAYRDGNEFTRLFATNHENTDWPPTLKFIDDENIADESHNEDEGIVTDKKDVTNIKSYWVYEPDKNTARSVPAKDIFHIKIDADSTEKRGRSRFISIINTAKKLMGTIDTEVKLRNLQASIILVRKVQGGSGAVRLLLDHQRNSTTNYPEGVMGREKIRPGTIVTTNNGVDIEFKQPQNNFSDASPLIAMLIQQIGAATGFTYEQLSLDSSNGSFATALAAESPVIQMIESERRFFSQHFFRLHKRVIDMAMEKELIHGGVPQTFWKRFKQSCNFGPVVTRNLKDVAQAGNVAVIGGGISHAEFSRWLNVDPSKMIAEIRNEQESGLYNPALSNQNPDAADAAGSSADNAKTGGANQGDGKTPQHKDNLETRPDLAK